LKLTQFAQKAQITDRTLRTFLKTGRTAISTFEAIAGAMGSRKDQLLQDEQE